MPPADPALLRVGAFELCWSGVFLALGLALAYVVTRAAATRRGLAPAVVRDLVLWSLPEALLTARVVYALGHPEIYFVAPSRLVQLWDGGYSFGAGLLVGTWAVWRYARHRGLSAATALDAAVPGLLIGQGLAALGRALGVITQPVASLPPWDQPAGGAAVSPSAAAESLGWRDAALQGHVFVALWALALLFAYAACARRDLAPGGVFRAYLLLQALGQIALRLLAAQTGPADLLGVAAWTAIAVAAALSARYHPRSAQKT
ncbi:MAG TPA: prolipoprotein diacylglyceryl transferase family protein [Chloroflexota bacterium]